MEQVLSSLADAKSPVDGESFPGLSPEYKKMKKAKGLPAKPNLEFTGDMLDSLDFKNTRDGVEIGFFSKSEAGKADGHNNFSGDSKLPQRRFLPDVGQEFVSKINTQIDRILMDYASAGADKEDFADVETKSDLYNVLGELFGGELSRTELKLAVLRNEGLSNILDDMNLLGLL